MYDVIVIGGSFAGQSAALQLARARKRILLIDGAQPRNRFADAAHGFLAQDGRNPAAIIGDAARQLLVYPTAEMRNTNVTRVTRDGGSFGVATEDGDRFEARRLILATGVRDELPPIPGLAERWGETVLHCPYCHGYEVRDHPLGIIANHPASAHQAALIPDWGNAIYFTQGIFEPDAEEAALLSRRGVTIERTPVIELLGNGPALNAVRLADGRAVEVAAVFTAPATRQASPFAEQLGCAMEDGPSGAFVQVDNWGKTSVDGVFAAGDAAAPMHNATLASAAGVLAGVAAHQSLVTEA